MKNALTSKFLRQAIGKARHIFLGLDYDGTLTSIMGRPDIVRLDSSARKLLKSISRHPKFTLAILSGRSIKDIRKQVGLKDILYSGNHGFEIYIPGKGLLRRYPRIMLKQMKRFGKIISAQLEKIPGLFIEDKGITIALHYRNTPDSLVPGISVKVRKLRQIYAPELRLTCGKKVTEIRPSLKKINKGEAFQYLFRKSKGKNILPIYCGDDMTDEDVFRRLRGNGVGIYVGKSKHPSYASFFVENTKLVKRFLEMLKGDVL